MNALPSGAPNGWGTWHRTTDDHGMFIPNAARALRRCQVLEQLAEARFRRHYRGLR
jgi:hypothetical protein